MGHPRHLTSHEIDWILKGIPDSLIESLKDTLQNINIAPAGIEELRSRIHTQINSQQIATNHVPETIATTLEMRELNQRHFHN